ncbi:histidine kinase [Marivirga lumbricoides]|uniref:histidine kinase n=1 Tax=Marivirga lumbricoides TaxID=1046115 RepID=A0ABQ1LYT8_9BACT|nr:histidine kinase [Marivirga lumbricoides]
MILRRFSIGLIIRLIGAFITLSLTAFLFQSSEHYLGPVVLLALAILQFVELYNYVNTINKKVIRFLESVQYSDFSSNFSTDNKLGKSFKKLNQAFNDVLEIFRKTRVEKEQNLIMISTILQNIQTGILSFDASGEVGLLNSMTKKLLLTPQIRNMDDIRRSQPEVFKRLVELKPGKSDLIIVNSDIKLALSSTILRLGNKDWKIVSLHNIYSELQQNELYAWQNLTKVLRHEIMNSITPIATLVSSMNDILEEDLTKQPMSYDMPLEAHEDLKLGLKTIENRSRGLVNFINAYRDYTNIPAPKFSTISAQQLIRYVAKLYKEELQKGGISLQLNLPEIDVKLWADEEQIQLILINLIKNAKESLHNTENPSLSITIITTQNFYYINVEDNGEGIVPEALERIFIPFFTTKKEGSGIGLALSRQIMQLHNGKLNASSTPGVNTTFTLQFPKER